MTTPNALLPWEVDYFRDLFAKRRMRVDVGYAITCAAEFAERHLPEDAIPSARAGIIRLHLRNVAASEVSEKMEIRAGIDALIQLGRACRVHPI